MDLDRIALVEERVAVFDGFKAVLHRELVARCVQEV
jgi:hypothetical protein